MKNREFEELCEEMRKAYRSGAPVVVHDPKTGKTQTWKPTGEAFRSTVIDGKVVKTERL